MSVAPPSVEYWRQSMSSPAVIDHASAATAAEAAGEDRDDTQFPPLMATHRIWFLQFYFSE